MKYHAKGKSKKVKMIALAIKGFTGTIGAAEILDNHPYLGLLILAIGAAANEVTNFINTSDDSAKPMA